MQIRVYYEDTDIGGVVYYANYLKFIERARSELFFTNNISPINTNGHFVVKNLQANYTASAKFGDILNIKTTLQSNTNASVTLFQEVQKENKTLFECTIMLVYVDEKFKPKKIPQEIIDILKKLTNDL